MLQHRSVIEFGIIGLGRFGYALTKSLAAAGKEIVAVDTLESRVKQVRNFTESAFQVSDYDKETLEDVGIQNCGTVIVCIGDSIDTGVLSTLNVISMGVDRVISRAMSFDQGLILEKIGAEVIYPENDMALRLASKLISTNIIETMELKGDNVITEFKMNAKYAGQSIQQISLRQKFGLNIIAIECNGETTTEIDPDYILQPDDVIVVIGNRGNIHKLEDFLAK